MLHKLLTGVNKTLGLSTAQAHCDIPCGIYDPISAQLAALSVIRLMDLIAEMEGKELSLADQAKLSRLVYEKETHAEKVKHEVRVIWGDYIKAAQLEAHTDTHNIVHQIMMAGSGCKQHIGRENGVKLLDLVNQFAEIFWQTKGVETYTATCPYAPAEQVVYPKLG